MKSKRKQISAWGVLLVIAGVTMMATPSSAAVLTFTDLASWQAAVTGPTFLEDFEGADIGGDGDDNGGAEDTLFGTGSASSPNGILGLSANANFSANASIDVAPFLSAGSGINGSVVVNMRFLDQGNGANPQETVTVTLPAGVEAFAFEYNNYDSAGDGTFLSFTGTNGGTVNAFDPSVNGFFGVVDTGVGATISSFAFTGDPNTGTGFSAFNSFDDVRYPEFDALKVRINTATGLAEIVNDTATPFEFNSYRIESSTDDLNFSGWNSLSDQSLDAVDGVDPDSIVGNGIGETWDEAGGSDDGVLAESFLQGTSLFGMGRTESLGNAFKPGGDTGSLSFQYRRATDGEVFDGVFEFVSTGGVAGDYNGNGTVDAADYTLWLDNLGASIALVNENPSASTPGIVDQEDYDFWKLRFGATSGSGATNVATIPEPTASSLLALGLATAMLNSRKRQRVLFKKSSRRTPF